MVICVGSAPFGRSGFWGCIRGARDELRSAFTWRDYPGFELHYARLSHAMSKGRFNTTFGTDEHKELVWTWAMNCIIFEARGDTAKEGRWFQVTDRSAADMPYWAALNLVGDYLSMIHGWEILFEADFLNADAADEAPLGTPVAPAPAADAAAACSASPAASASAAAPGPASASARHGPSDAAASHSACGAKEPPLPEVRKNVSDTAPSIPHLRNTSRNMLDMSMKIVRNTPLQATWMVACKCALAARNENADTLRLVKTSKGCLEYTVEKSLRSGADYIKGIFEPLVDTLFCNEVGVFQGPITSSWALCMDDACNVMASGFAYACELGFQELAYTARKSKTLPGMFGGLLRDTTRSDALERIRRLSVTFDILVEDAKVSEVARQELDLLVWPDWTWVLEMLLALMEMDFIEVSEPILSELAGWARAPKSTLAIEDLFNACRGQATSYAKAMSASRVHHISLTAGLDQKHGRPLTPVSTQAKVDAPQKLDPSVYKVADIHKFSLGDDLLKKFLDKETIDQSSGIFNMMGLRFAALQRAEGDAGKVRGFWKSLLIRRGVILWPKDGNAKAVIGLVIGSCDVGVAYVPVNMLARHGGHFVTLAMDRWKISFLCIGNFDEYRALDTQVFVENSDNPNTVPVTNVPFILKVPSVRPKLLEAISADDGFRFLTIPRMKMIADEFRIDYKEKKPRLEKDWALLLVQHFLPHLSLNDAMMRVNRRNLKEVSPYAKVIHEKSMDALRKAGELSADDVEMFEKASDHEAAAKKFALAQSAAAARGEARGVEGFGYAPKDLPDKGMTLLEARAFSPKRAGCWIGLHKDESWQAKTPYRPKTPKSQSAKFSTWGDNRTALISVLKFVWAVEAEMPDPEHCPYTFSEL